MPFTETEQIIRSRKILRAINEKTLMGLEFSRYIKKRGLSRKSKVSTVDLGFKQTRSRVSSSELPAVEYNNNKMSSNTTIKAALQYYNKGNNNNNKDAIIQRLKCNNNKNKGWHAIIIIIKVDMQLNDLVNFLLCNNIKYAVIVFWLLLYNTKLTCKPRLNIQVSVPVLEYEEYCHPHPPSFISIIHPIFLYSFTVHQICTAHF